MNLGLYILLYFFHSFSSYYHTFHVDFVIKLNAKRARRFDLSEAIFKCE